MIKFLKVLVFTVVAIIFTIVSLMSVGWCMFPLIAGTSSMMPDHLLKKYQDEK